MGLIKAGIGAVGGTLADQWKEFFYCEAIPKDVLVTKGEKRTSGRSSNTRGNDNTPDNIIIKRAAGGNDSQICQNHSHDESDDSTGYLGCPFVLLLQPDG